MATVITTDAAPVTPVVVTPAPKTTLQKVALTILWVGGSAAVNAGLAQLAQNPDLFNPVVYGIINIALVTLANLFNPHVKNV